MFAVATIFLYFCCSTAIPNAASQARFPVPLSGQLLVGRGQYVKPGDRMFPTGPKDIIWTGQKVERVKGSIVGKESAKKFQANSELKTGTLIKEFDKKPGGFSLAALTNGEKIKEKKGKMLSDDVEVGRYVPNPAKALGELLAGGGQMPEIVQGEILAGDWDVKKFAEELDALTNIPKPKNKPIPRPDIPTNLCIFVPKLCLGGGARAVPNDDDGRRKPALFGGIKGGRKPGFFGGIKSAGDDKDDDKDDNDDDDDDGWRKPVLFGGVKGGRKPALLEGIKPA